MGMKHEIDMSPPATIATKTIYTGVTALAREAGISQGYVSKLLARGYPPDAIREKAVLAGYRREMRAVLKAARISAGCKIDQ